MVFSGSIPLFGEAMAISYFFKLMGHPLWSHVHAQLRTFRRRRNILGRFNPALRTFAIVLLLLTTLVACAQSNNNTTPNQTNKTIVIGASIARSGDFSADGKPTEQGYQLWADTINKNGGLLGRQVKLDLVSDASTPESVTLAYQKLINVDKVDLVVGPFADFTAVAAARVAARSDYPLIEGSGTAVGVFQQGLTNLFSVSLPAKNYLTSFGSYILSLPVDMRPKTAAYATQDDPFLKPQVDESKDQLERGGIRTVTPEIVYPSETSDYTPIARKLSASGADLVVLGTVTQDCVAYVKAFRQQHYNPKALIAASGPDQGDQFTKPIGGVKVAEGVFVPNGGWYPDVKSFQNDTFQKAFVAKYGGSKDDISSDSVQAYSVMQVLEQAVNSVHSINKDKLLQNLRSGNTFNTLQGPVKFASDGENSIAVAFLFQWQNGSLIPVFPQGSAQANPEYPKPVWP
jgi:branched-chain amino acid transport system substrate-binding protein